MEGLRSLTDIIPRPGHRAVGEERAWGRRLAKRFGVDSTYDEQSFVVRSNGQSGFLDHESLKPEKLDPDVGAMFRTVNVSQGRVAHRVRLDHGRGPAQAGVSQLTQAQPASFEDVVRRRRMTRAFDPHRLVPADVLDDLVDAASRAPSAGKTQGWHVVVLEGPDTARFWDITLPADRRAGFGWPGLLDAPLLAAAAGRSGGVRRPLRRAGQARPPASVEGAEAWPVPYWTVDTSFAVMTLLLAAEARGPGHPVLRRLPGRGRAAEPRSASPRAWSCWGPWPSAGR